MTWRPIPIELHDYCPCCGEPLDEIGDCLLMDCANYLCATERVYSPLRDVREPVADSERFLPVKESA
jgi:hypothetical protein